MDMENCLLDDQVKYTYYSFTCAQFSSNKTLYTMTSCTQCYGCIFVRNDAGQKSPAMSVEVQGFQFNLPGRFISYNNVPYSCRNSSHQCSRASFGFGKLDRHSKSYKGFLLWLHNDKWKISNLILRKQLHHHFLLLDTYSKLRSHLGCVSEPIVTILSEYGKNWCTCILCKYYQQWILR